MVAMLLIVQFLGFSCQQARKSRKNIPQTFISSKDGPIKSMETRQGWKQPEHYPTVEKWQKRKIRIGPSLLVMNFIELHICFLLSVFETLACNSQKIN